MTSLLVVLVMVAAAVQFVRRTDPAGLVRPWAWGTLAAVALAVPFALWVANDFREQAGSLLMGAVIAGLALGRFFEDLLSGIGAWLKQPKVAAWGMGITGAALMLLVFPGVLVAILNAVIGPILLFAVIGYGFKIMFRGVKS